MIAQLQQVCLGAAAVFDTVLLLALLERRNWPFVRLPIIFMLAGAWLWHAGQFALLLLADLPGRWPWHAQSGCMTAMAAGLLLMPCGMVHGAIRVWQNRLAAQSRGRAGYAGCYLPMLFLVPVTVWFFEPARGDFYIVVAPLEFTYAFFIGLVDVLALIVFFAAANRLADPQGRRFFFQMAIVFLAKTILQFFVFFIARAAWPDAEPYWLLILSLAPLAPALLFAYFVIRYGFLQILVERSLVYGTILGGMLFAHQRVFQDVSAVVPEEYRLHIVALESLALTALILGYQPLRERTAEALRYLLGSRVSGVREGLRRLSIELSAQAGRPPRELLAWFVQALRDALNLDYVAGCLVDASGQIDFRHREPASSEDWPDEHWAWLRDRLTSAGLTTCSRRQAPDREVSNWLQEVAASLIVLKARPRAAGLLVLGRAPRNRELGEEETGAVLLLVEQLAATLENGALQNERQAAERRALHGEKLTSLGLLAGSIAHEVKNPLSAIKTIATVLAEDLGPEHSHAEDVRLILGEVDRLSATTAQLLSVARPRNGAQAPASLADAVHATLRLLRHIAEQQQTDIHARLPDDLPTVRADDHALREIFFNLLSNSLDAAGPGGQVSIACHRDNGYVVAEVRDSGPGMPEDVRARLFEPFLTTKDSGTGLGLYVVARRISEIGGRIHCDSAPDRGTCFTLQFPYEP